MAHGFYSKTLTKPKISRSGETTYVAPSYEVFKGSLKGKKLKWNLGTEHNPSMFTVAIKNIPQNQKAVENWLRGNNWSERTSIEVELNGGVTARLGDLVKDQVKPGTTFNRGNVSEGILAAAIAARFVNKLGTISNTHVLAILEGMIRTGKKLNGTFKGPNENTKILPDNIEVLIGAPDLDMIALKDSEVIRGNAFDDILPAAVHYANDRHVTEIAELIYRNNRTDHILVDSDGVGNMKGTKVDLSVKINGKPTTLNISLKAGVVSQFGQISGGTVEIINKIFNPLGAKFNGPEEIKFNEFLSNSDHPGAMLYAYREITEQLDVILNSTDGSLFWKKLGNFVKFHATRNEKDVELVQLHAKEAHVLIFSDISKRLGNIQFKTHFSTTENRNLKAIKTPTSELATLTFATRFSSNPRHDYFVRIRSKVEVDGKGRMYFRNLVEKGPQMSELLQVA